jgi:hypothetical protein
MAAAKSKKSEHDNALPPMPDRRGMEGFIAGLFGGRRLSEKSVAYRHVGDLAAEHLIDLATGVVNHFPSLARDRQSTVPVGDASAKRVERDWVHDFTSQQAQYIGFDSAACRG